MRNVFVVGPDKKIKLILVYPMTTGRNFDEVLRVIDSLQLTAKHKVATPVNWKRGDDVIIAGSVSDDEAREKLSRRLGLAATVHPGRAGPELSAARLRRTWHPQHRERPSRPKDRRGMRSCVGVVHSVGGAGSPWRP